MRDARHMCPVHDAQAIINLIDEVGMAYMHDSGCYILKDETWIQPEQWDVWINFLEQELAA
ncbi:MAG: hypothetical protein ACTHWH_05950 [Marinobacter sp.]